MSDRKETLTTVRATAALHYFKPVPPERLQLAGSILIVRSAAWPILNGFLARLRELSATPRLAILTHHNDQAAVAETCGIASVFFGYPHHGPYRVGGLDPEWLAAVRQFQPDEVVVLCNEGAGQKMEQVYELAWHLGQKPLLVYQGHDRQLLELVDPNAYYAAAAPLSEINWYHQVPLRDGRITPGRSRVYRLEDEHLYSSIDFTGKSVLDIGCWDGYFSFMAEQRGARRVVAFDNPDYRYGGMDGFLFLKDHFQSKVEFVHGSVFVLPPEKFDIVLCYGVLYHLSDPLAAIINCFQIANESVLVKGLIRHDEKPRLELIPPGKYQGDVSNIYLISDAFLSMIAELNGFTTTACRQWQPEIATMRFDRVSEVVPKYPHYCYPIPPVERSSCR